MNFYRCILFWVELREKGSDTPTMNNRQLNIVRTCDAAAPPQTARTVPRAGPELARPGPPGNVFDGFPVHLVNQWPPWYRIRYPIARGSEVRPPPIRAGDPRPPNSGVTRYSGCSPGIPPPLFKKLWIAHGPEPPPLTHLRSPPAFFMPRAGPSRASPAMWKHIPETGPPKGNLPPGKEQGSRNQSEKLLTREEIRQGRVT